MHVDDMRPVNAQANGVDAGNIQATDAQADDTKPASIDEILESIENDKRTMPDPLLGTSDADVIEVGEAMDASTAAKAAPAQAPEGAVLREYCEEHIPPEPRTESFTGRIFCIIGKSSSGKDTIWSTIKERFFELGIQPIIMYTTRPQRTGETDGVEYNFITAKMLDELQQAGKVVERRDYNTSYGTWSYAIIDDGQIMQNGNYIIKEETPAGYKKMAEHFGAGHVRPLYIYVDDGVRLMRALSREIGQDNPRYDEMCRRYLADAEDFKDIDADASIPHFINDNLEKCSKDIIDYLVVNIKGGATSII